PSVSFPEPATSIGVFAFTSTDSEKLNRARALFDYRLISFENGKFDELVDFDDIKDHRYTTAEENRLIYHRQRYLIGTPAELEAQFAQLASETGTEEILIATFAETKEDRMESYRLLGEMI
ncbi:MAG: LLM class flavin-dependent oxidoreductase, partial [Chitinophagaceae bacterium]|nr:LLM class flavin-dependent oxidoreductase [Chitinophagaceae bacterium]